MVKLFRWRVTCQSKMVISFRQREIVGKTEGLQKQKKLECKIEWINYAYQSKVYRYGVKKLKWAVLHLHVE